jgi:deoxyribodipyrimidine photolyase-related protein
MHEEGTLILPHQLFRAHPAAPAGMPVWLVEHDTFFRAYDFHIKKIIFHRATMHAYADELRADGCRVTYLAQSDDGCDTRSVIAAIAHAGINRLHIAHVYDRQLEQALQDQCAAFGIAPEWHDSPYMLTPAAWYDEYLAEHNGYHLHHFYIAQRKRMGILMNDDGTPTGGKWSFDQANRKPLADDVVIPDLPAHSISSYVDEALQYAHEYCSHYPGSSEPFPYPVRRSDARAWLTRFLEVKLYAFGDYQDAIVADQPFLFHSILSPLMNVGLLTPQEVVDETLAFYAEHADSVPINALEGFLRQIIGWREFMWIVYERSYEQLTQTNFFRHKRALPAAMEQGTTGLPPVDVVAKRVLVHGYAHHIERLMVLGNSMLLCGIDPHEVYRYFSQYFIDAYDWVMVPNVYGMSQFADGGLFATKPYISSSNYICKMSDFAHGDWCDTWDSLFWHFLDYNRELLAANARMGLMLSHLDRMSDATRDEHAHRANGFIGSLYS